MTVPEVDAYYVATMGIRLILGFAICFTVLIVAPALLPAALWPGSLMRLGDAVDLLTPLVLISGYYLLYRSADDWASEPPPGGVTALFLFGSILFIQGQGIHLAANSIGHQLPANAASAAYALTYFYDEHLGHYLWHAGMLALAGALMWRHYLRVKKGVDLWSIHSRQRAALAVSAVLYGGTLGMAAIEGQTVLMVLPLAVILGGLFGLSWRRQRQLPGGPTFTFLGLGFAIAAVALIGWGVYWRGFPQFSDLGII